MLRIFLTLLLVLTVAACGGQDESTEGERAQRADESHDGESRSMIPEKIERPTATANVFIKPCFDEQGTVTELSVAPGETFMLHIRAEYEKPFQMAAAEYRFELPSGIRIVDSKKFTERMMTIGDHHSDFVMAFPCEPPRKFSLMTYTCEVDDTFDGGTIETVPGLNSIGDEFLGFVECPPTSGKIPASGGVVTIKKK